jgi:uncharacterized membrane protein YgcG
MFKFLLQFFSRKEKKLVDIAFPPSFHVNTDMPRDKVNALPEASRRRLAEARRRKLTDSKEVSVDNSGIYMGLIASAVYDAEASSSYSKDSFSGSGGDFGGGGSSSSWDSSDSSSSSFD